MDQYRMIEGKDFISFLSGFSSFIKKIAVYVLTSIREYMVVSIGILAIFLAIGFWSWKNAKPYFEYEMVCSINDLSKKAYGEMIHDLDKEIRGHSYSVVAHSLGITANQAQQILSIEGKNEAGSMLYEDVTAGKDPIYIQIRALDTSIFKFLQPAILSYLSTASPYLMYKRQVEATTISAKMKFLKANIATDDSILGFYYARLKNAGLADTAIDPKIFSDLLYHKDYLDDKLLELYYKFAKSKLSVQMVHGYLDPTPPTNERKKSLKIIVISALFLSVFAPVLFRIIHDVKVLDRKN